MPDAIILQAVAKSYRSVAGTTEVFENVDLTFGSGAITAILGPTGCGKTTLLNLINGLTKSDKGSVTFPLAATKPRIGTVLQKDLLLPWRDVRRNIVLGSEVSNSEVRGLDPQQMLDEVGLRGAERMYPDQLSGGMRKKVSLVRTLLFDPDIVLFDEPFANIDYFQKLELEAFCTNWIRQKKRSSIFVTHDIEEAIAVSDRIIVLSDKPARVIVDFPVALANTSPSDPIAARRAPQFRAYFESVWGALKRNG